MGQGVISLTTLTSLAGNWAKPRKGSVETKRRIYEHKRYFSVCDC